MSSGPHRPLVATDFGQGANLRYICQVCDLIAALGMVLRADSEKHTFSLNLLNRVISTSTFIGAAFHDNRILSKSRLALKSSFSNIDFN